MEPKAYVVNINAAKKEAEMLVYDEIGESFWGGGISSKQFINDLNKIEAKTIHVRINSPGGSPFEASNMYNALGRHGAKIITHVDGLAASAASLLFMAGSERDMAENAFVMIHNAWGMSVGDATAMRTAADQLDLISQTMVKVYADASGASSPMVKQWMDDETWMDSTFALEHGFVQSVTENLKMAASIDLSRFKFAHVPDALTKPPQEQRVENDRLMRIKLERMRARVLTASK